MSSTDTKFGTRVTDASEKDFLAAVEAGKEGANVFGTRVTGRSAARNPKLEEESQSEFGIRVANNVKPEGTAKGEDQYLDIEKLDSLLEMNPTFFDSLYSLEMGRKGGPRKAALKLFKVHEQGPKGAGRQFITDEINSHIGEGTPDGELRAAFAKAEGERIARQALREEENALLVDADRIKALKERADNLKAIEKAGESTRSQLISPDAESQNQNIQREQGGGKTAAEKGATDKSEEAGTRKQHADQPTRSETQSPHRASQKEPVGKGK